MTAAGQCTARDSPSWPPTEGERERERPLAEPMKVDSQELDAAGNGSPKKGLAIIVTNDYTERVEGERQRTELTGTKLDGKRLKEAFEALDFEVQWKPNISKLDLEKVIAELKRKPFESVKHYRCIVLVFSGHGEKDGQLIMQDGRKVDACKELIDPLLPGEAKEMGDVPKVFIIDACRGDDQTETTKVPKLVIDKGSRFEDSSVDPTPHDKGGYEIQLKDLPKKSNFLVAYSTLPGCTSSDYHLRGSLWLEILAKKIPTSVVSIDDLLTDVNEEMMNECERKDTHYKFQQPEKLGRLNKKLFLRDRNLSNPDPTVTQTVAMDTVPFPDQHKSSNSPALQSQQLDGNQGITSSPSGAAGVQPVSTPPTTAANAHVGRKTQATALEKGSQPFGDRLKERTKPKYDYISEEMSPGVKRYRCKISYRNASGKLKYADSGGYLTTKTGAAEHAAKRALKQEGWLPLSKEN